MHLQKLLVLLISLYSLCRVAPINAETSQKCRVIGRVVEGDSLVKAGTALCEGQNLIIKSPILVTCIPIRRTILLSEIKDIKQCDSKSQINRNCLTEIQSFCTRFRNHQSKKPILISPYGTTLEKNIEYITWKPVFNAQKYRISILSNADILQITANSNQAILPKIRPSSSVQIVIEAISKERVISTSSTTINILNSAQKEQLESLIQKIDSLNIEAQEKIKMKLSIFEKYNLIDRAIRIVSNSLDIYPSNPTLKRILGDLYLEAGFWKEAEINYQVAKKEAKISQDEKEYVLASLGLDFIMHNTTYNQEPTNTAPPQ
ncbi:MAG TPA: hypothetical protein V6D19_08650 [Stenomitos sp.]